MGRVAALLSALLFVGNAAAQAPTNETLRVRLFADTDDDDGNGATDAEESAPARSAEVRWFDGSKQKPLTLRSIRGGGVRIFVGAKTFTEDTLKAGVSTERFGLQGLKPGMATIDLGTTHIDAAVCEFSARDVRGNPVDLAKSHASISRTLPPALAKQADGSEDFDALSWTVICPAGVVPPAVEIESLRANGTPLDALENARILPSACPPGVESDFECGATAPIRATSDSVDRNHPTSSAQSLQAEVGGRIVLQVEGRKAASIRVGGPRETAVGSVGRYRGHLRFHLVRLSPGGSAPVGGNEAGALTVAVSELRTASALWGQCGIVFGPEDKLDAHIVDPPPSYLLALGCDIGLPASGGQLTFRADGRLVTVTTRPGETPVEVAHDVAKALTEIGLSPVVSPNARVSSGALRTADVLVRRADGSFAQLSADSDRPLSADATMTACLGEVDLSDGLSHFNDLDAVAGTVEERTLLKAFQDEDPSTVDVFVIPSFSQSGRIGESFIDADRSSIRNAVIIDRAGIRAGARSFALAHELGHILLDMPGHPDDYGIDRPWILMDADAADPTIFGPRRLPVSDCERAILQSGPNAALPLLQSWPLYTPVNAGASSAKAAPASRDLSSAARSR